MGPDRAGGTQVDAYSNYILQASKARLEELRREAAEHALSKAARGSRVRWWKRSPAPAPAPERCPVCLRRPRRPSTKRRVAAGAEPAGEMVGAGRR
jgi:hypothetical protein